VTIKHIARTLVCGLLLSSTSLANNDCQKNFQTSYDQFATFWKTGADQYPEQYARYVGFLRGLRAHWDRIRKSDQAIELIQTRNFPRPRIVSINELANYFEWKRSGPYFIPGNDHSEAAQWMFDKPGKGPVIVSERQINILNKLWSLFPDALDAAIDTAGIFAAKNDWRYSFFWKGIFTDPEAQLDFEFFFYLQNVKDEDLEVWAKTRTLSEYLGFIPLTESALKQRLFDVVLRNDTLSCLRQSYDLQHLWSYRSWLHESDLSTNDLVKDFLAYLNQMATQGKVPSTFLDFNGAYVLYPKATVDSYQIKSGPLDSGWHDLPSWISGLGRIQKISNCLLRYEIKSTDANLLSETFGSNQALDCSLRGDVADDLDDTKFYSPYRSPGKELKVPNFRNKKIEGDLIFVTDPENPYFRFRFKRVIRKHEQVSTQEWSFYFVKDPDVFAKKMDIKKALP